MQASLSTAAATAVDVATRSRTLRGGLFVTALLVCLAPWPGLGHAYVTVVCAVANVVVQGVGLITGWAIDFSGGTPMTLASRPNAEWHAVIAVTGSSGAVSHTAMNLRAIGWVPSVTYLCLAAIWPLEWTQKGLRSRALGFAAVQAYFAIGALLPLALVLSTDRVALLSLSAFSRAVITDVFTALVVPPGMSFAVPSIVWAAILLLDAHGIADSPKA